MGVGTAIHYLGSVLLFAAMILTIVVDVSAPVVKDLSFVNLNLPGGRDAQFGVFGYCVSGASGLSDGCSNSHIGYDPAKVLEGVDDASFSTARADSTEALTRVFILHPVGTVVLFIAFLLSLLAGHTIFSILATLVSAVAFVINAIAVIVEFVTFNLLLHEVRKGSGSGKYGAIIYVGLVAAALTLLATIIMLVTCCAGRKRRSREARKSMQY